MEPAKHLTVGLRLDLRRNASMAGQSRSFFWIWDFSCKQRWVCVITQGMASTDSMARYMAMFVQQNILRLQVPVRADKDERDTERHTHICTSKIMLKS